MEYNDRQNCNSSKPINIRSIKMFFRIFPKHFLFHLHWPFGIYRITIVRAEKQPKSPQSNFSHSSFVWFDWILHYIEVSKLHLSAVSATVSFKEQYFLLRSQCLIQFFDLLAQRHQVPARPSIPEPAASPSRLFGPVGLLHGFHS